MNNKETLQQHNTRLGENNVDINDILNTVNNLPTIDEAISLQDKTVIPTKETQTITADESYNGLSSVIVEAIPDNYIEPNGVLDITENGEYDVKNYATANVNIESSSGSGGKYTPRVDTIIFNTFRGSELLHETQDLDPQNFTTFEDMFSGCRYLRRIDVSGWKAPNVINAGRMFYNCQRLTTIDVSKWETQRLGVADSMFNTCSAVAELDVSNWNTQSLYQAMEMFYGCEALTTLDLSKWNTTLLKNVRGMFQNCAGLTKLDIRTFTFEGMTNYTDMLGGTFPANCLIIVNGDAQKEWLLTNVRSDLTNIKTVAEYQAEGGV